MQQPRIKHYSKPSIALFLLLTMLISLFATASSLSAVEDVSNRDESLPRPPMLIVVSLGDESGSPGLISFINMLDNSVITTIDPQGANPHRIVVSPDKKFAYVVDATSRNILVVDLETFTLIRKFVVPGGTGDIEISPDGTLLYIAGDQVKEKGVSVVDAASGVTRRTISIGEWPGRIALNSRGDQLWYASGTSKFVYRINLLNDSITPIAMGNWSSDIAISPDEKLVYVLHPWTTPGLSVIDVANNVMIKTIPFSTMPLEIAITADGSRVYVSQRIPGMISVIDGVRHEVLTPITGVGSDPGTLIITPDQRFLYVSEYAKVWKVDLATKRVVGDAIPAHVGVEAFAIVLPTLVDRDARITIVKDSIPDSPRNFRFYGPFGEFRLDDPGVDDNDGVARSMTYQVVPGSYGFSELQVNGWRVTDIRCSNPARATVNLPQHSLTLNLLAGDDVTCTFVNEQAVTVYARAYWDKNVSRFYDVGEPWKSGVWTEIFDSTGKRIVANHTDSNGQVGAFNLAPGAYSVCQTPPTGWWNTQPGKLDPRFGKPCYSFNVAPAGLVTGYFGWIDRPMVYSAEEEMEDVGGLEILPLLDADEETFVTNRVYLPMIAR